MNWKCAWKELPEKDGIYLCEVEEHYGVFIFRNGKFEPNFYGDFEAENFTSSLNSNEDLILHWMELPAIRQLTETDKIELSNKQKEKQKEERRARKMAKIRGY